MRRFLTYTALSALLLTTGCASTQPRPASSYGASVEGQELESADSPPPGAERELKYPEEPEEVATTKGVEQVAALKLAAAQYRTFIQKAASDPRFREAVKRAKGRVEDINATIAFLENAPSPPAVRAVSHVEKRRFDEPNSTPPSD